MRTAADQPDPTVAVILAAGGGSRFRQPGHKLNALLSGRSIVHHAVTHAVAASIGPVVVVTGAVEVDLGPEVAAQIIRVHNPRWADGQAGSLALGVAEAKRMGATAIVAGLGDQPFIEPVAWRRLARSSSPIAVATYDGARRNPVRLHQSVWHLLPHDGDLGARTLIKMRPDLVGEVPCPGSPADIDTVEDLQLWQNKSSTSSP